VDRARRSAAEAERPERRTETMAEPKKSTAASEVLVVIIIIPQQWFTFEVNRVTLRKAGG
jgi:hypothetical protein